MADHQLLRVGKISSVNYPYGTARVTYEDKGGSTTSEIPFLAWEYWMPKIGEQVLVGHLSSGSSHAVILGPFWCDKHRPIEGREGVYRKEYTYDQNMKSMQLNVYPVGSTVSSGTIPMNPSSTTLTFFISPASHNPQPSPTTVAKSTPPSTEPSYLTAPRCLTRWRNRCSISQGLS